MGAQKLPTSDFNGFFLNRALYWGSLYNKCVWICITFGAALESIIAQRKTNLLPELENIGCPWTFPQMQQCDNMDWTGD